MMPTPSHPIKSWNRLFAVTKTNIVIRKNSRYLKNQLIFGSECIYHMQNSMTDYVINSATGINIKEK
jgi:hypothetical protein